MLAASATGVEGDVVIVLGILTLVGVVITGLCTIAVARVTSRTHTEVKSSNGSTTAQTVEAVRAFQIAHDIDDERRFITLFRNAGLSTEEALSRARDAMVIDRRVSEQQAKGEDVHPFLHGDVGKTQPPEPT